MLMHGWVDAPCQIIAQRHKTLFTTWHYFEPNSKVYKQPDFQLTSGLLSICVFSAAHWARAALNLPIVSESLFT